MSGIPEKSPLCGPDYFILAMDHHMRQSGLPGNLCRLVVHLNQYPDLPKVRKHLQSDPVFNWLSRIRLKRGLPLFLINHYKHVKASGSELIHEENSGDSDDNWVHTGSKELLLRRRPGICFEIYRQADGTTRLELVWHHVLMDAIGAEYLLKRLALDEPSEAAEDLFGSSGPPRRRSICKYLKQFPMDFLSCRQAARYIASKSLPPIHLAVRQPSLDTRLATRHLLIKFEGETFHRIQQHCQHCGAQLRKGMFYLAATCMAIKKLGARIKAKDGALVISVPIDRRRVGARSPMFQNHISFQFFRIEPQQNVSLKDCLQHLQQQTVAQVKENVLGSCSSMMKTFCGVPISLYSRIIRGPSEGKLSSFSYAYTGTGLQDLTQLFDCDVFGTHHQAPLTWPPGLAIVFSAHKQKLTCSVSYLENGWLDEDCEFFKEELKHQLTREDQSWNSC